MLLENESVWAEVIYNGNDIIPDLQERLFEITNDSPVEILRVRNDRMVREFISFSEEETLEELSETDVFNKCLDHHEITGDTRIELEKAFDIVLSSIHEGDTNEM